MATITLKITDYPLLLAEFTALCEQDTLALDETKRFNTLHDALVILESMQRDRDEIEAQETGISYRTMMRRRFRDWAHQQGCTARFFKDLVIQVHDQFAYEQMLDAEDACRGHLTRPGHNINPAAFWYQTPAYVRKHASEELLAWFDENGRVTRKSVEAFGERGGEGDYREHAREDWLR